MRVRVQLFGDFRHFLRETDGRADLDMAEGATVLDVLERVKVSAAEVGLVSVNREMVPVETLLGDGDAVDVFSPLGGG